MPAGAPLKEIIYKDIDIRFVQNPNTKNVEMLSNAKAISRAVKNLVLTNRYERPYKSKVSSDVTRSLFENFTPMMTAMLRKQVEDVIRNFEPRADVIDVRAREDIDSHALVIDIIYRPINAKAPVEIAIFLERVR